MSTYTDERDRLKLELQRTEADLAVLRRAIDRIESSTDPTRTRAQASSPRAHVGEQDVPAELYGLTQKGRIINVMQADPARMWRQCDIARAAHVATASVGKMLSRLRDDRIVLHDPFARTWQLAIGSQA